MISAAQILTCGVPVQKQEGEKSPEGAAGLFEALFSLLSANVPTGEDENDVSGESDSKSKKTADQSQLSSLLALFASLYQTADPNQITGLNEQQTGSNSEKAAVLSKADITDVLEGNFDSGSKDIASMLTEIQSCTTQTAGGKNEEIMARMPQIIELMSETDSSAAKEIKEFLSSRMCPLENASEEMASDENTISIKSVGAGENQTAVTEEEDNGLAENSLKQDAKPETGYDAVFFSAGESLLNLGANNDLSQSSAIVENAVSDAIKQFDKMISSYNEQNGHFKIQLEPEYLGKLSVSISMGRDGLTARIQTENAQVQNILAGQIDQLIDKLGDSGIQVKNVDVVCADMGGQQNQRDSDSEGAQQRAKAGRIRSAREETAIYEGMEIYDLYTQIGDVVNSVEYRV
ncbi:MAG: flagellar hook-length control protein FliK [Oscillospiraceae bacterium]